MTKLRSKLILNFKSELGTKLINKIFDKIKEVKR